MANLANHRSVVVHEADAHAHAIAGGKCRDVEAGVREFHRHEAAGDAVPRRPSIQQFSRTLSRDLDAVRNAVTEKWSNGQPEGQINRLKTLKRAMYGRASIQLLRARMLPLEFTALHGK
jgi:hypothetical protein